MEIRKISKQQALRLIVEYHYSKVMPKLNKLFLGGFFEGKLMAVMTLGWGVRPLHTIRKLFPSLSTKDYWEIGKLCVADELPKNTESEFISGCLKYVKTKQPQIKLIYTWADGMLGKAGYVYQASNFVYGGFIWTDTYFSDKGEKIHPRTTGKIGGRPSEQKQKELGFKHYFGKQFRYCFFLCSKKEQKRLLKESTIEWTIKYPKEKDLEWKTKVDGKIQVCKRPFYNNKVASFNDNAIKGIKWVKENTPLDKFINALEVSRADTSGFQPEGVGSIPTQRINKKVGNFFPTENIIAINQNQKTIG